MRRQSASFSVTDVGFDVGDLARGAEQWLLAGDIDQHSKRTLGARRDIVGKLLWFLRRQEFVECGTPEIRAFFHHLTHGHEQPGGRWGNPQMIRPVRPRTVHTYHGHLRTLFRWLVAERMIDESPMERIPVPTARPDQVQPFTDDQVDALLEAACRSKYPKRNEALLLFLLDTGCRASEVCALKVKDLDISARRVTVLGKGNKHRTVFFGKRTAKALYAYLRDHREPDDPLFISERMDPLTRSGLLVLVHRLGVAAAIDTQKCSPHVFRHTFAVSFLRAGGNSFTLQNLLGHTNIAMTMRYVALAQADMAAQHAQFSPADRLRKAAR